MHHANPLKKSQSFSIVPKPSNIVPAVSTGLMIACGAQTEITAIPISPSSPFPLEINQADDDPAVSASVIKKKMPRRSRPKDPPLPLTELKFLTVAQASVVHPGFTEKAFRHLIASAEAYAKYPKENLRSNGFIECIVRPGGQRKILLIAEKLTRWINNFACISQVEHAHQRKES